MPEQEQQIPAAPEQHWASSAASVLGPEHDIYRENAVCEYPQIGRMNTRYAPNQRFRKSLVTEYVSNCKEAGVYVSIMELKKKENAGEKHNTSATHLMCLPGEPNGANKEASD